MGKSNFTNSIGHSGGSGPINTRSLFISGDRHSFGAAGKPAPEYGADKPGPQFAVPGGCKPMVTSSSSTSWKQAK
jgi:hypothetical protein